VQRLPAPTLLDERVNMALTLMFFPIGLIGTLAKRNKLPSILNWD
jgi:hypothetical protein|tara:strand:- start:58 stop:192 length:135 start_codon:yes stop_codon:yes gene_type:complete